jgi:hypothetical protein
MFKLSKEMRVLLVILVVGGGIAYYMTLGSDTPVAPHKPHTNFGTTASQADSNAITPQDLTAYFPRYSGGSRDPFDPVVVSGQALRMANGRSASSWSLTGINTIDGVTTALIENSGTGDSVFLKVGDKWNGLRLTSIGSDNATFVDGDGKVTQLSFSDEVSDTSNTESLATAPPLPTGNPLPVPGTVPTGGIAPFPVSNVAPLNPAQQN